MTFSYWRRLRIKLLGNLYPPLVAAGVRVKSIAPDFSVVDVEMGLHLWNRNYVGVHFGGSLYAMCDPFFMIMLMEMLGPDYIVWDKAASIKFIKPGRGKVRARFAIPQERVVEIKKEADAGGKVLPVFDAEIVDSGGGVIAEVEKLLYVRKKRVANLPP